MPDEITPPPTPPEQAPPAPEPSGPPIPFEIGEEFGTAKKNLPPTRIVLIGVAVVLVVVAIFAIVKRSKPSVSGSIQSMAVADIPDQGSIMVALNVSLKNDSKQPYKLYEVKADLDTGSNQFSDEAASGVDFERYFEALPMLREESLPPLAPETVIQPGDESKGTVLVSFPVSRDVFSARKSLKVTLWAYHESVPLVLTQ